MIMSAVFCTVCNLCHYMPNMIEAQAGLAQSITDHMCCLQTNERVSLFCQHSERAKSRSTFGDCHSCMVQRPWRYSMRLLISWFHVCDIVMLFFIVAVSLCLCSLLWLIRSVLLELVGNKIFLFECILLTERESVAAF